MTGIQSNGRPVRAALGEGPRGSSIFSIPTTLVMALMLVLAAAPHGGAQQGGEISGAVHDQNGAPVPGARIELIGNDGSVGMAATDRSGGYRFQRVPSGQYTVRVSVPGFLPVERSVTLVAGRSAVMDIRLEVIALDNVVVTAARVRAELEAQRELTPGGVTIVEGEELFRRPVNGLADLLRYVPGVWAESSAGGDELYFSSRGSNLDAIDYDRNGVKLFQDGLPITAADGNNHNRVVDPLSVRYAMVARGANGMMLGASTLGGAMDFVSPTARNSAPISVFLNTGGYGPFNGRISAGLAGDVLDGLVTVEGRRWDGYRDQSSQERWGVYANAGWRASDRFDVRVFGTHVDNSQRIPDALTRAEVDENPRQASAVALGGNYGKDVVTSRMAARMNWAPRSDRSLMAGVSYETQSLFHPIVDRIMVDFDGPGPLPPVEVFSLLIDTDHRDLGGVVRYNHRVGAHDMVLGLNYGRGSSDGGHYLNDGGRPNGIRNHVDNRAEGIEAYWMDRWSLSEAWTLVLGAQYVGADRDVRSTSASTGDVDTSQRRYHALNPRVGIITSLAPGVQGYANVSRLYEAPTTFQMEDDVLGDGATLEPMSGRVVEAGVRSTADHSAGARWAWDVAAYYAGISNEILSVDDPEAPGTSLTTNVDRTVHAGIEAVGSVSIPVGDMHRVDPLVSLTVNHFRFVDDAVYGDNALPAAPTYSIRGELIYRRAGGVYVGPTFDMVGRRYADFSNTYPVDGHALLGVRAGWSSPRWELFGELRNALDTEYSSTLRVHDVAAPDARTLYPGTPRVVYFGARISN